MQCLYRSTTSPLDQLIQLHSVNSVPPTPPPPPGVRRVVFHDGSTILEALTSRHVESMGHGTNRTGPLDGAPHHASALETTVQEDALGGGTVQTGGGFGGDVQDGTIEHSVDNVQDADDHDDSELVKNHMAFIIQTAFRRMRKRLEAIPQDPLAKARYRHARECRATARAVHARCRKRYLGPLPQLLFSVEWTVLRAQELKKKIKMERANASLQDLSDLMKQQTLVNGIVKEGTALLEQLKPGSPTSIHSAGEDARWLEDLRSAVVRARHLIENLSDPDAPMDDFKLAFDGIMPEELRVAQGPHGS
ncbi:hypothetical protein BC834DRAFT_910336, partial [Gloeopeniophorella convolvens]